MAEKPEVLIMVSLVLVIIVVIFFTLISLAANVQALYCGNIIVIGAAENAATHPSLISSSIVKALLVYVSFGVMGAPLSWGMSMLSSLNPSWWLNGWLQWYLYFSILASL
ncbi:MAG: hypothetical protein QXV37_04630 [Candidatus Jordarchaeaceae archaeon]